MTMLEDAAGYDSVGPDGIKFLRLSGRGALNLLGLESFRTLNSQLDQIAQDAKIRAVIITGTGDRHFSAGVDLLEMKELTPSKAEGFIRTLHEVLKKLMNLRAPVIAAIQGQCLGGALELALACDIRSAADDSKMGLPEVKVGIPSVIEASLLPATVGLGRARRLLLTGDSVDAQEALGMGLVDRVLPWENLLDAALDVALGFSKMSPQAISLQKDIVVKWLSSDEEESTEFSIRAFVQCFESPNAREAMVAFLEKREPDFG